MSQGRPEDGHRARHLCLVKRMFGVAMGLLAMSVVPGCALSDPAPGPSGPRPSCGDGVCSPAESVAACPADCVPPVACGDGLCTPGETCASCPTDCERACVTACQAVDLPAQLPAEVRDTTASGPTSTDPASCGDGAVGPLRRYRLVDLPPGRYRVSAVASFDLVVAARRSTCGGEELACEVAYRGALVTFSLGWTSTQTLVIEVAGVAGGAGAFTLEIAPEPRCGDAVCQEETCTSCPADCGACPPPAVCGDRACQVGQETCASCPADCGACPTAPRCGDGSCQAGETCGACPADCGACSSFCGDGACDATEGCASCPGDCGSCAPSCGNGSCDLGEDCLSCPFDCAACGPTCGDGWCDFGEDCTSCSFDCGACAGPDPATDPFPPPDPGPPPDPFPDPGADPWWLTGPRARPLVTPGAGPSRAGTAPR